MKSHAATHRRRLAYRRGHFAETLCVLHLRLRGYQILARRYRTPVGEIDIVARRGSVIAAIEVKARNTEREALEAVTARQQHRIVRALEHFQASHPGLADYGWRFDVMWTGPMTSPKKCMPRHILDAWRP